MKKLLIMSMTLLFSVPIFAQTKTLKNVPSTTEPGGKTAITRPGKNDGKGKWNSALTLLRPTEPGGKTAVTRPSRPSASGEEAKTLPTLIDKTGKQTVEKTKVVRPTESSSRGGTRRR